MKVVKEITWNWQAGLMETNGDRIDAYSDTCDSAVVGENRVDSIIEKDNYFEINYSNKVVRVYNPNTVTLK